MKPLITIVLFSCSMLIYSQKNELKELKKALKSENYDTLKSLADKYKNVFESSESDKYKSKYNTLRATAYYHLSKKNLNDFSLLESTAKAFEAVKGDNDMANMKAELIGDVHKSAISLYNKKDYLNAMQAFEKLYRLSPKDTLYLYSAASVGLSDKDLYSKSLEYYNELLDLDYDGGGMSFSAINKSTGKEEVFSNKKTRDLSVKLKTYEKPKDTKEPSKKAEIIKNVALILLQQDNREEALKAIDKALEKNPNDSALILSKADVYYKMGDNANYKKYISQAIEKDPNNSDLYYNLGVSNTNSKDYDEAIKYYKKALEIDPNMLNAVLNMSSAYLEKGNTIINQMNEMSDTKKNKKVDWKKYDKLKEIRKNYFEEGAKTLEEYLKNINTPNKDVLNQLKSIYAALGDTPNFKRVKALLEKP